MTNLIIFIFVIAGVVFAITGGYLLVKFNMVSSIPELITNMESFLELTGPEKMDKLVGILYSRIPAIFKKVLTLETVRSMAQGIYDSMKEFTIKKLNESEKEREDK